MADMRDGPAVLPADTTGAPTPPAAMPASVAPPKAEIAGFWRRLVALFVDMIVLGIVGFIIGTFAFRQLVEMGQSARLIGAAITLVYCGVLNSGLGGGGTLGKRMLGLRVVQRDGQTIGLARSLLRTIVFWTPFYLDGATSSSFGIPGLSNPSPIASALTVADLVIVFGGLFLIFYLYIFNWRTRQTLHDLIAGTFVVRAPGVGTPLAVRFWKGHLAVAATIVVLVFALPLALLWSTAGGKSFAQSYLGGAFQNTTSLEQAILARPGVASAEVATNTMVGQSFNNGTATSFSSTTLTVVVQARGIPVSTTALENDIAATVLATDPGILGQQNLSVKVMYGYNLGIWSWSNGEQFTGTPAEWAKRLRDAKQTTSA
jgi:uncharacterized RDD family membrane protein YckC